MVCCHDPSVTNHVDLFDVVAWGYGFVHSGVIAWLLEDERYAGLVLTAATNAPWDCLT